MLAPTLERASEQAISLGTGPVRGGREVARRTSLGRRSRRDAFAERAAPL